MARFGLLLSLLGVSVAGCTFIFDESGANLDADVAGTIDASGADARDTDFTTCGVPLEGTIGYFPLDGEGGNTTLVNTASAIVAASVEKAGGVLQSRGLMAQLRDGEGCGHAALLSGVDTGTFVRIDAQHFKNAVSVDFWFRTDSISDDTLGGLLSADGNGTVDGDFGIFVFKSDDTDGGHHVLLRIQGGSNIYYGCSEPISLSEWHHVAATFDGIDGGAKLFVDGVRAANQSAIVPFSSVLGSHPCGQGGAAREAILAPNTREWVWGASNTSGPQNPARDGTNGLIDELRFRDLPFTVDEAALVYESLPRP